MKKQLKPISLKKLLSITLETLEAGKAIDIKKINLKNRSSIADFMIIASGNSSRQVASLANNLIKNLKNNNIKTRNPEGLRNSDWVLIDAYDLIIHLFRPEVRDFYALEKMWEVPNTERKDSKIK